jgi:hypothetical protein
VIPGITGRKVRKGGEERKEANKDASNPSYSDCPPIDSNWSLILWVIP